MEEKVYYAHNFVRKDARGSFVEAVDSALPIGKMMLNFCKYNGLTNKMEYTIPIYLNVDEALYLTEIVKNSNLYRKLAAIKKQGLQAPAYSKLTGISMSKIEKYRAKLPFEVPAGKTVSKTFDILPSTKYDYLLKATYRLGSEDEKGLIIPEGKPLAYIMIALSHEDLCGFMLFIEKRIQAYETAKMIAYATEYDF